MQAQALYDLSPLLLMMLMGLALALGPLVWVCLIKYPKGRVYSSHIWKDRGITVHTTDTFSYLSLPLLEDKLLSNLNILSHFDLDHNESELYNHE